MLLPDLRYGMTEQALGRCEVQQVADSGKFHKLKPPFCYAELPIS